MCAGAAGLAAIRVPCGICEGATPDYAQVLAYGRIQLFPHLTPNGGVTLQDEARGIAQAIKGFLQSGVPGSEIAVLYPKHLYGDLVEAALFRRRIAYRRYGNTEILDRCPPVTLNNGTPQKYPVPSSFQGPYRIRAGNHYVVYVHLS